MMQISAYQTNTTKLKLSRFPSLQHRHTKFKYFLSILWCTHMPQQIPQSWSYAAALASQQRNSQRKLFTSWYRLILYIFFFFTFSFHNCIVPVGFSPWEIRVAFPGESQLQQSCTTRPTVHTGCFSVSIIHWTLTWTTGSLMCAQTLMHMIARGGIRTPWESLHWKFTLGEKSHSAQENWIFVSCMPVGCSSTELHPHHFTLHCLSPEMVFLSLVFIHLSKSSVKANVW